jgi:hypothetical protein
VHSGRLGEERAPAMYTVRHYLVRLRWSKRRPYRLARWVVRLAVAVVALVALLNLLGVVSLHRVVELWP